MDNKCDVCGNMYDKSFQITMDGESYTFDCFECAIHALAPACESCGVTIIGHGVEDSGTIYCCAHCAEREGVTALQDRI
jgi:hypothetical protein